MASSVQDSIDLTSSLYEVIDGVIVEKAAMGAREVVLANILAGLINRQTEAEHGYAHVEVLFELPNITRQRRPDLAYVSYERWPRQREVPEGEAWAVVPEIAVEVISPTNRTSDLLDKFAEYFQAGVSQCWMVLPRQRQIHIFMSPTAIRVLTRSDLLTAEPIIPRLNIPLTAVFREYDPLA